MCQGVHSWKKCWRVYRLFSTINWISLIERCIIIYYIIWGYLKCFEFFKFTNTCEMVTIQKDLVYNANNVKTAIQFFSGK